MRGEEFPDYIVFDLIIAMHNHLVTQYTPTPTHTHTPAREPVVEASSVETWKSLSASSTWLSIANGDRDILASDSDIRIMASNCLHNNNALVVNLLSFN